jgi:hypothetical protein
MSFRPSCTGARCPTQIGDTVTFQHGPAIQVRVFARLPSLRIGLQSAHAESRESDGIAHRSGSLPLPRAYKVTARLYYISSQRTHARRPKHGVQLSLLSRGASARLQRRSLISAEESSTALRLKIFLISMHHTCQPRPASDLMLWPSSPDVAFNMIKHSSSETGQSATLL